MAEEKTYLELSQEGGGSHKFYEVTVNGAEMTIRYGRIGDTGRISTKEFATEDKARAEAQKKINSKVKKGYEAAVMGVREKRAVTRRVIESKKSEARQSPVLWKFDSGASAFGIFIDEGFCWVGNETGRIFMLDHDGQVKRQFKLPDGVKCIVADDDWLYAGCDDGKVYDLSAKVPHVAYEIENDVDIYWLDICDGVLGVSDAKGHVTIINHEDESQWDAKSSGKWGWMVRCDEIGVYHGHGKGVTMYDWEDGSQIWHQDVDGQVLFGWQEESTVFAATSKNKVFKLTKQGEMAMEYQCDNTVYSCAATEDGKYVFAGDDSSSIYCFGEDGKRMWKMASGCGSAYSMQYVLGRLYVVTTEGALTCIDASEDAIKAAEGGVVPKARSIKAPAASGAAEASTALETTSDTSEGVVVECYKDGSKLRVRVLAEGYDSSFKVQFPKDIREDGARYVVAEIRESSRGGFYRAYGDIKKIQ